MSWKKVKLGQLVDNFSVRAKDVGGAEGLDFYGVSNSDGIIKTKYAAEDKAEDYKIIEKDCFAYNPYRVNVGSIGMVADNIRGLISPAYVIFKPKPNIIKAELLFKFLKSSEGLRQIKFYARGTVRQALRFEDLCNIELSIPNYDEQEILFEKLNNTQLESDLLSIELNNQLDLVKKIRQQLLQDAVQGKLVKQSPKDEPASELLKKIKAEKVKLIAEKKLKKEKELSPIKPEEIPFEIPENWVWCKLGEIIQYTENLDIQKHRSLDTYINYIDIEAIDNQNQVIREVKQKSVSELSTRARRVLKKGYILYSTVRPYLKNIAIIDIELENFIGSTGFNVFKPVLVDTKYVFNFLLTPKLNDNYKEMMVGFNSPSITNEQFEQTLIPLPPLAEQNRIVQKLNELMQHCNDLEASIKQSQQQNEKLLQQVLREALRGEPVGV